MRGSRLNKFFRFRNGGKFHAVLWGLSALGTGPAFAQSGPAVGGTIPAWLFWAMLVAAVLVVAIVFRTARTGAGIREAALNTMPGAVLLADRKGAALFANSIWRETIEDFGGHGGGLKSLEKRLYEDIDNRAAFRRLMAAAIAGDQDEADLALTNRLGHREWRQVSVFPVDNSDRQALWVITDCPVRNALDTAISAEQELLTRFMDEFPIGYFSVDREGRIVKANQHLADILETTPDALIGADTPLHALIEDTWLDPETPWSLLPDGAEAGTAEINFKAASGDTIPTLVSQSVIAGGERGLQSQMLVRELGSANAALAERGGQRSDFDRFFDEAPVGLVLLSQDGVVTECSAAFARMAGREVSEIEGSAFCDCAAPDDRDRLQQWIGDALQADNPAALQVTFAGADRVIGSLFGRRFDLDNNGNGGLVVHVLDQTEHRDLENQFIQSQKMEMVGQLAGGIAHDFNNLLTAMIGFCDLLLQRHSPKDQSFADIMQIKQNANRAANLVRQLLAFSRQQTLQPRVINVTDVLAELSHLLRRLIGADIKLEMVHGGDPWPVKVDQSQLEQVIINLVVNARDAIGGGGSLSIHTRNLLADDSGTVSHSGLPTGDYVVMEVTDTGSGISRDILDKIFEPFFTTKGVGAGTGLGLSTVYGIIKQTGGHIFVDSEIGEGTCFTIYLPKHVITPEEEARAAEAEAAAASEPVPPADLTGAGTIMLVEDEDAVRIFGARALKNKGYTVIEASSGIDALEMLEDGEGDNIDILITDVVMPGMDGPTMIREVRKSHPDMKVVFISGYTEDSFRQRLDEDAGDIHFLPKPFTLDELASKVKEIMDGGS
jgi:two-component system cell cycle sensor histidine kinase/response regulator CckA